MCFKNFMGKNCRNICEKCKIKYKEGRYFSVEVKNKILQFKCLICNRNFEKEFDKDLK